MEGGGGVGQRDRRGGVGGGEGHKFFDRVKLGSEIDPSLPTPPPLTQPE
jgi:hypothetical protein